VEVLVEPAELAAHVIASEPELQQIAEDLHVIGGRFASKALNPVVRGDQTVRGLSWRCQAIASANLLRGEELFRFAILAINEGAIVVAHVLTRALDETLSAVVFARRRVERAVRAKDAAKLEELLNKITAGSRFMAERKAEHPAAYNVLSMVDEMGAYLAELVPEGKAKSSLFREDYEFVSEFVHPSIGSFSVYQTTKEGTTVFNRAVALGRPSIAYLCSNLRMAGHLLIAEAEELAGINDLPLEWPG